MKSISIEQVESLQAEGLPQGPCASETFMVVEEVKIYPYLQLHLGKVMFSIPPPFRSIDAHTYNKGRDHVTAVS